VSSVQKMIGKKASSQSRVHTPINMAKLISGGLPGPCGTWFQKEVEIISPSSAMMIVAKTSCTPRTMQDMVLEIIVDNLIIDCEIERHKPSTVEKLKVKLKLLSEIRYVTSREGLVGIHAGRQI